MSTPAPDAVANPSAAAPDEPGGLLTILREWADALVIAFVLAMFVRVFIVELFKIPSGSMTPTLVGDEAAEVDLNSDGLPDLVVLNQMGGDPLVFMNRITHHEPDPGEGGRLRRRGDIQRWRDQGAFALRQDRILVNKFAYWRSLPSRGDIVVFKVPEVIWDPAKPIYIKRCAGLPGDRLDLDGRLRVNGRALADPPFFRHQLYQNEARVDVREYERLREWVDFRSDGWGGRIVIDGVRVPPDSLYMLGDNTASSADSRFWGFVPADNIRGKAFLRYWPFPKVGLLD